MLWGIKEIAEYASYGETLTRRIAAQPDFPKPIRVFNGGHPRWEADEVRDWFRARKDAA